MKIYYGEFPEQREEQRTSIVIFSCRSRFYTPLQRLGGADVCFREVLEL